MTWLTVCCAGVLTLSVGFAAETPSPALLVLNKDEGSLAIIDPASGKSVAHIPTGEAPHELTVSSDGRLAFAGNYGSRTPGSTLSVFDLAGQKELHRVDLGPLRRPHGVFFAGGKLYFTAELNNAIGRYDPEANSVDWILGTGLNGTHMVRVSNDLATIYTANIGSNSMCIIQRGANPMVWTETVIGVGKGPEGFDLSPDGNELWAAHSQDGGISIIDTRAKTVGQTLDIHTKRSNRLKFTPDGKRVLVSDLAGNELVVLDAPSRKEIKRIAMGRSPEGILIVPDGSRAYVAEAGENRLAILDLATLAVTGHIETGKGPDGMAWAVR